MTKDEKKKALEAKYLEFGKSLKARMPWLSEEEIVKQVRKTVISFNMTFIFADVLNTFLTDTEELMQKMGHNFMHEDKRRFNLVMNAIHQAKVLSQTAASPLYKIRDTDEAMYDSDWWYNFVRLVDDHVLEETQLHQLLEFIMNMPVQSPVFDVKYGDFVKEK